MSTNPYAPTTAPSTTAPATPAAPAALASYMKGAGDRRDGGWGRLTELVKSGRKIVREEKLRWQENREFYRGNQNVFIPLGEAQLRTFGPITAQNRSQSNTYNRLRQFTDARTALLTKDRPSYEVAPEDQDQDSLNAARQAEALVNDRWDYTGWNVKARIPELSLNGDIDGIAWLSVMWDPNASESMDTLIAIDRQTNQPIMDRQIFEAMKAEDPNGTTLWQMVRSTRPMGEISWRVVLPGALSIDPTAVRGHRDAHWICESRSRPRAEVEEALGISFKDAVRASSDLMGVKTTDVQYEDFQVDDGGTTGRTVNENEQVVVNYFFARPCYAFPKGLHVEWCDKAPGKPIVLEAWQDDLPYFAFVPRPDPGHFLRSHGMVDDLKPIQRDYNRTMSDLREWLKRVARTPVALPFGSMASDEFFSEDGYFFYHPQMGEPHFAQVPAEPTAVLTNDLDRMVAEMRDISGVSAASQGLPASNQPEAAVGLNIVIQQTETNLSMMETGLIEAIEWGVSRSLKLVEKNYTGIRMVSSTGVNNSVEFNAFHGAMLRGAHRFKINGPMMGKSKAARMAALQAFLPILAQSGANLTPYMGAILSGDPTEFQTDLEIDRNHQMGETSELTALASNPLAQRVFADFSAAKAKFTDALNLASQVGAQDPIAYLQGNGDFPPNFTQMLQTAGFDLPIVEDFDNHALELKALDEFRKSDGYRRLHEMSKQLLREHAQMHKMMMGQMLGAMSMQQDNQPQGSAPRQPGIASAPRPATPQPGGLG